jgi:hypothetical protein
MCFMGGINMCYVTHKKGLFVFQIMYREMIMIWKKYRVK